MLVTAAQVDRWARDFNNWGICDTVCFVLFDRVNPDLTFRKVEQWAARRDDFVKRAAFALLACLALHTRTPDDEPFLKCLPLIARAATDNRNFVKKGVSWALRGVGRRRGMVSKASIALAGQLAESEDATARWVGKDAIRDLVRSAKTK